MRSRSLNLAQDHKLRLPTEFASTITSLLWKVLQPQATGNCSDEVGGFSRSPEKVVEMEADCDRL